MIGAALKHRLGEMSEDLGTTESPGETTRAGFFV